MNMNKEYGTIKDHFKAGYRNVVLFASVENDVKKLVSKLMSSGFPSTYKKDSFAENCWMIVRK